MISVGDLVILHYPSGEPFLPPNGTLCEVTELCHDWYIVVVAPGYDKCSVDERWVRRATPLEALAWAAA